MYQSTHELVSNYNRAITALAIDFNSAPFLDIQRYNPTDGEQELMYLVINIAECLDLDLHYLPWFHTKNDAEPFQGQTPWEYIIKNKKKGLLEVTFYVQALVSSMLAKQRKLNEEVGSQYPVQPPLSDINNPFY